ncbi:MAG TPA: tetratricopeptide repeat protein, partial [Gemmataceae bacterium]|nr:tetratricopeptide repeat protein [Gemmataceae bacterium]
VLEDQEKLVAEFPRVPAYRRDLAGCLNNLGALLYNTQRLPAAEAPLRRALALRRELAADPSALPGDRSQLATAHYNLANLLKDLDQHPEAEDAYREARRQFEKLVSEFPQTIDHRHVLGAVLNNLSRYPRGRGDLAESRALLERAIEHQSIALRSNPQHPRYREYLANHYRSLVEILIRQAEHGEAARIAAEAPRLFPTRWQECVRAAEYFSRCVPLAEKDARLPEDLRRTQAQVYADQAMTWLRDAAAKGCKDLGQRTRSAAFDPLRGRADFQKLVQDWEAGPTQQPPP